MDIIERLKNYIVSRDYILLAFLFGSAVRGHFTKESDLDIALLFNKQQDIKDIISIADELSGLTERKIDLLVLNNAAPVIKMQVIKNGIVLKGRETPAYNQFFMLTIKEYDDLKRKRKVIEDNILKGRIYA